MSSILDIAVRGLNVAATRSANAVSSIVNASSTPKNAEISDKGPDAITTEALVDLKIDQVNYDANAFTIKIAQKLDKALLDIKT